MPIYGKLLNFLFYIDGSFKYFSPINDVKLAQEGDYMLIMGKHDENLEYLKAGGVSLNEITLEEIETKLKELEKE